MSKTLSPAQAAQVSGVSRWTILRAIKKADLKAFRDNRNHWKIEQDDLDQWCNAHVQHTEHAHPLAPTDAHTDLASKVRIAELETENRMLRDQTEDLKADRDAWKDLAQRPWWRKW